MKTLPFKRNSFFSLLIILISFVIMQSCSSGDGNNSNNEMEKKVNELIKQMTLNEKLGQLNQFSNPYISTGTSESLEQNKNYDDMIRKGLVGSFLNVLGAEETMRLQKIAIEESRLGIPIIFGYDVIHGYKTMFPIPLADAASFDREAMKLSTRIAAIEASANGIHWTFAPMVDISRDPRWGRIMEGAGEDVFLGEQAAIARIKGFQGDDLSEAGTIAACAKHFAAYGAAYGGRDYNMADMSERMMREVYLPPFKAAVDAGVATFMSAFNTNGGVPASGDKWLQTDVLRNEWGFDGFVVSDWTSVTELMAHSVAETPYDAAFSGLNAGVDMDMMGRLYLDYGQKLIDDKKITISQIDEMVKRVLRIKYKLGLFTNPYQYHDKKRQEELTLHPDHLAASRDVAKKSIVLLKNENNVLPITDKINALCG